ncbi:hypothetical protein F8M41_013474 [Gigaspora margarita]|uniref:Uncharacterized protein n=1 Tax=Gigaspora margarita TaxID=4874 RepID=A0A8H3WYM0_GIGMA|nr:hypothetical protein F8M41_013474 [Gigaspora margarita]
MASAIYLNLTPTQIKILREQAIDWALSHGLILLKQVRIDWALSHGLILRANSNPSSTTVHDPNSLFQPLFPKSLN